MKIAGTGSLHPHKSLESGCELLFKHSSLTAFIKSLKNLHFLLFADFYKFVFAYLEREREKVGQTR